MPSPVSDSAALPPPTPSTYIRRATKIVATLGPATSEAATIEALIATGVNVVRLNFSHGSAADHIHRAALVRQASERVGREVAIMADLQGPKIRVGRFEDGAVMLQAGQAFVLDTERTTAGDAQGVGVEYRALARDVQAGDILLLDDGLIELQVLRVQGPVVHTSVRVGGRLASNKGINKRGGGLSAPALTAKDMEDIRTAVALGADYVAVSFPKSATDMEMARQLCLIAATAAGTTAPGLIAKMERAEAIPNLHAILAASDGIMVARGDLAVEVGHAAVPALQKRMIAAARSLDKLTIIATQMMESMITAPVPTRAEVSDVANAVLDGTDAVMLSAETATGRYPVETVREMARICAAAEHQERSDGAGCATTLVTFPCEHPPTVAPSIAGSRASADSAHYCPAPRVDQAIARATLLAATQLNVRAIVALTDSGATALWMSRTSVPIPIYALTPRIETQRRMALFRNVRPILLTDASTERSAALAQAEAHLRARSIVGEGDLYAITSGDTMGQGTNVLQICRVGG